MSGFWWVAHTRPRAEKALAFHLLANGVDYYLPMRPRLYMSGGKKRKSLLPLFPSYLFVCGDESARVRALESGRIVRLIPVTGRGQFVQELQAIEQALSANAPLDAYPFASVGRRCRVRSGPFLGIEGTVVQRNACSMLVLSVSMLGSAVALEIEPELVESAES